MFEELLKKAFEKEIAAVKADNAARHAEALELQREILGVLVDIRERLAEGVRTYGGER